VREMLTQFTDGLNELSPGDIRRLSATMAQGAADLPCRLAVLHIDREASRHNPACRGAIARAGRQAGGAVLQAAARGGGNLTDSEARRVARVARDIARGLSAGPIGARHAGVLLEAWQGALAAPGFGEAKPYRLPRAALAVAM
jgi:hypothetical protein